MLFGRGFNSAEPADSDLVRHPTKPGVFAVIRELREMLKNFFQEVFDLDTGDLLLDSVPGAAIQAPRSNPSGEWDVVQVDRKGLVVRGVTRSVNKAPRAYAAIFFGDGTKNSTIDTPEGTTIVSATADQYPLGEFDGDAFWSGSVFGFQLFTFVVPDGVYRVRATLVGCGKDFGSSAAAARQRDVAFSCTPGQVLKIWAGNSDGSPSRIANADQTKYADSGAALLPVSFPDVSVGWYASEFADYGSDGTAGSTTGTPGFVMLEWYA